MRRASRNAVKWKKCARWNCSSRSLASRSFFRSLVREGIAIARASSTELDAAVPRSPCSPPSLCIRAFASLHFTKEPSPVKTEKRAREANRRGRRRVRGKVGAGMIRSELNRRSEFQRISCPPRCRANANVGAMRSRGRKTAAEVAAPLGQT